MSKIPSPPFQIWGAELGAWEVLFFVASEEIILFSVFFQMHFGIDMFDLYTIVLIKRFGLWLFFPFKESCILFQT